MWVPFNHDDLTVTDPTTVQQYLVDVSPQGIIDRVHGKMQEGIGHKLQVAQTGMLVAEKKGGGGGKGVMCGLYDATIGIFYLEPEYGLRDYHTCVNNTYSRLGVYYVCTPRQTIHR